MEKPEEHNPMTEAEAALQGARDARDAHLETPQPSEFEGDRYTQWVQTRDQLISTVSERETAFAEQIEQAPAQELSGLAAILAQRRAASGNAQATAQDEQSIDKEWTPKQEQMQTNDRAPNGRGYANYAATAQAEQDTQQSWDERNRAYRQANIGAGAATVEQIEAWEQKQRQTQPEGRSPEQQAKIDREEQDWNARHLRGR